MLLSFLNFFSGDSFLPNYSYCYFFSVGITLRCLLFLRTVSFTISIQQLSGCFASHFNLPLNSLSLQSHFTHMFFSTYKLVSNFCLSTAVEVIHLSLIQLTVSTLVWCLLFSYFAKQYYFSVLFSALVSLVYFQTLQKISCRVIVLHFYSFLFSMSLY